MRVMHALAEKKSTRDIGQSDFLTEWIKNGALVSLILDAVSTVDWTESDFELATGSGYAFRPLVMLTVVTYCCANGVCSSKDIALKTSQDAILRFLCEGTFPTWQDIREFRRHNRDLIKRTIIEARKLIHEF